MKYYLIVGEASGDLHASNLMEELKKNDTEAEFRFYGGDKMAAVGGTLVKHYKELAYMGFLTVLMHLPKILKGMKECKKDIKDWQPDAVILVDYPGFNLNIAEWVNKNREKGGWYPKIYYYISPKIWAWKEYRIESIKRNVDELFSILPFEVEWFKKRDYTINYVGNPCVDAVNQYFGNGQHETCDEIEKLKENKRGAIALLAGSRKQEIKDNLKIMIDAASHFEGYKMIIAGAPNIEESFYQKFIPENFHVAIVYGKTYDILKASTAALVTSGTATLEAAIIGTPQVVCYHLPFGIIYRTLKDQFVKCKFISLVNLVAEKKIVNELIADEMNEANVCSRLLAIMPGGVGRDKMLNDYKEMNKKLGGPGASAKAAKLMVEKLAKAL
ncbi:MAG: lipid-A-disaccharide synthase [Bacteroidaceae bacterium]|nr:lipid-A-disaccharide synthase [Bacteroidaceae bacterium]